MKCFNVQMTLPIAIAIAICLSYTNPANAALATIPTASVALASFGVATAGVTAGSLTANNAIKEKSTGGLFLGGLFGVGGLALGFVDPPAATFYDGSFTIHYDSSLMKINDSGWLGAWGENPSLLPPPTDTSLWGSSGVNLVLQAANSGLSANVLNDAQNGLQTVTYDWGSSGHPEASGAFNLYGTLFEFTQNVEVTFLTDATQAPSDANFYVSTNGFTCTLPGDDLKQLCGEPKTSYYKVSKVPEPAGFILLGIGFVFLKLLRRITLAS